MSGEDLTLTIEAKGEVISSNFPAFAEMVRARLAEISRELATDKDFDQADADARAIAGAEASLKAAKEKALADAEQLHELFSQIDGLSGDLAKARLELTRQIAKRKEEVKAELVAEALGKIDCAARLRQAAYGRSLAEAAKGKRTVESMRKALEVTVSIHNGTLKQCRGIIADCVVTHGQELVPDFQELEVKSPELVEAELRRRVEARQALAEVKRLKAERTSNIERPTANIERPTSNAEEKAKPLGEAAHEEWKAFRAECLAAFKPLKAARERLTHSKNIAKAQGFANAINSAWEEWS